MAKDIYRYSQFANRLSGKFLALFNYLFSVQHNNRQVSPIPIGISYDDSMLYIAYGENYICHATLPLYPLTTLKERFEKNLQCLSPSSTAYRIICGIPVKITWHYEQLFANKKQAKECFTLVSQILDRHLPINKNQVYFDFSQTALSSQTNSPHLLQIFAAKKNEVKQYLSSLKLLNIYQLESQILALLRAFEFATQENCNPSTLYIYQDRQQSIAICWLKNRLLTLQFKIEESLSTILKRFLVDDEMKLEQCVHYSFCNDSNKLLLPENYRNQLRYIPIHSSLYPCFIALGHLLSENKNRVAIAAQENQGAQARRVILTDSTEKQRIGSHA